MGLSISGYDSLLKSKLQAQSYNGHFFNGAKLPEFTLAVATGVINTSLGLTGQINSPANIGSSSGVGITISDFNISNQIKIECVAAFGQEGPVLQQFTDAVGEATQEHFALAALTSDTNGSAIFPAFLGVKSAMATAIENAAPTFAGTFWPDFCQAIANGICDEIGNNGTGTLSGATGTPGAGGGVVNIS